MLFSHSDPLLERGLINIFRLFAGVRFGWQLVVICGQQSAQNPRVLRFPGLALIETGCLLVYLTWKPPRRWLGRAFLPLALIVASAGPIFEYTATVLLRLRRGVPGAEVSSDYWLVLVVLFAPLVLTSWRYGVRGTMLFIAGTGLFELLWAVPVAVRGGPRWLETFGAVLVRGFVYLLVGYLVARLAAVAREQREALTEKNAQLAHYAATVERLTVSHERNRLARELHDTLAHTLSAVAVQIEATNALWDVDLGAARAALLQAQKLTDDGLTHVRRALHDLRAQPLDDLGLALAVEQIAEQGAQRAGLTLRTQIEREFDDLSPDVEQSIYRITEEAVENVVRHANAQRLTVKLQRENGVVRLTVQDNGTGFNADTPLDGHFGLVGMRERAALCGGELTVTSAVGEGTIVQFRVGA